MSSILGKHTSFLIGIFVFTAFNISSVEAHVPNLVQPISQSATYSIGDPTLSQAFYGELEKSPHTYEFHSAQPFHLFVQILVPDIESAENIISGIIIKVRPEGGRVIEINRLSSKSAEWKAEYEPFGGDSYRMGPKFDEDIEAGTYKIEVHTPDNIGKYVLVVGTREEMNIGYFELLRRLRDVKVFFGKPQILIIQSPFVYAPLIILCAVVGLLWYRKLRRQAARSE